VGALAARTSPLMAYRWKNTDAALEAQITLDAEGSAGAVGPGHAAVRFTNPTNGSDALVTLRMEMHRLAPGATTVREQRVGSSVWQVFEGEGTVELDGKSFQVEAGDVVAIPSWCPVRACARSRLDLFTFSDAPVYEALNLATPEGAIE